MTHGTSIEEIQLLLQAAKGRRFAAILERGTAGWMWDFDVEDLLAQERSLVQEQPSDAPLLARAEWEAPLDSEDLVTAYITEFEISPSETADGRLTNVRRAAERRLMADLVPGDLDGGHPLSLETIEGRLGPRTALLLLYVGQWVDRHATVYGVLIGRTIRAVVPVHLGMPFPTIPVGLRAPDMEP